MSKHKHGKGTLYWGLGTGTKIKYGFLQITLYFLPFTLYPLPFTPIIPIAPAQAQKAPAAVGRGYALLKKGWVNDAIAAFQQALKQEPQSLQARLGLAIAYNRAGKITDAWNSYQQVLAQDPNNQGALKIVGIMATYRPEWNVKGIQALTTLLNRNPNDFDALTYRALLYAYQQRLTESIADYKIVLANNPSSEAVIGAAQAYSYSENFPQALELFNRYRSSGKSISGYAAVAYGRTLRETGNPAGAVKVLEAQLQRSKKLDGLAIETRKELAVAYIANEQTTQALAILEPLQGRSDALLPLGRSLNEIRKRTNNPTLTQQVINLYRQTLANNPNPSPALLREVADVFAGFPEGRQTALQLYRQVAVQYPNDKSLVVRQIALENQLGILAKNDLKQRLAEALQPLPADRVQLQQLANALVNIDAPDSDFLPIYQNILQSGVSTPFLNFRVAQMYVQRNDLNNARQALAAYTATSEGTKNLAPQLLAAEIERREGSLDASAKRYQAVLTSKPDNDITDAALRGLGGVRLQQKRFDEALAVYDQLITRNPQDVTTQLGRTSVAYQARRISQGEAEAVLDNWLATQRATNTPPELYSLVGVLPAQARREALYNYLAEVDPNYLPVQLRLVQVLADRNPTLAQARVKQLIAKLPNTPNSYLIQGELARTIGDYKQASTAYENILAQQPDNIDALSALGGIRFQQGRYDSAQQIFNQVLAQKPDDIQSRRALADLNAIFDQPLTALAELEQLQIQQGTQGSTDADVSRRMQEIQEDFLQRRGFQPPWEDPQRRGR
ncbi:tetratricopeptide repeat protein [Scytonema hofmannii FACHB-248]|uniref:Tetratricopeptide repeat protein n=1 Tax=Scytonema hofmannii FACHB-248 TaxID=1842502 RepID=A0ABR8GXF0_9CYAN|nr:MULTISPECIES: tetratricopeptide repeat protein [Nostocales]MBD2607656.1 tetratricopeptide repeat protein [Scytonema hofmannii FACHB-248]